MESVAKEGICDRCLGRMFGKLSTGMTNDVRGAKIRAALSENGVDIPAPNGCPLCDDVFDMLDLFAESVAEKVNDVETDNFLVGSRVDPEILQKEKEICTKYDLEHFESIKTELNREIGKVALPMIHRPVEFKNPQCVACIDTRFANVDLDLAPIFIKGRYNKLSREIPQTIWPCRVCKGKGCPRCHDTGKMYQTSVQEIIGDIALKMFDGKEHFFHGMGREDIDALCLGEGRPFVLEISQPRRRDADLDELELLANESELAQYHYLQFTNRDEVKATKLATPSKTYRVKVKAEGETVSINITSNTSWKIEESVETSRVTLSQTSGTGNATISAVVTANPNNKYVKIPLKFSYFGIFKTLYIEQEPGPNTAPAKPEFTSPVNGAENVYSNVKFAWNCKDADGDTLTYHLYLSKDGAQFDEYGPIWHVRSYSLPEDLDINTKYYAKLKADDGVGETSESDVISFTTASTSAAIKNIMLSASITAGDTFEVNLLSSSANITKYTCTLWTSDNNYKVIQSNLLKNNKYIFVAPNDYQEYNRVQFYITTTASILDTDVNPYAYNYGELKEECYNNSKTIITNTSDINNLKQEYTEQYGTYKTSWTRVYNTSSATRFLDNIDEIPENTIVSFNIETTEEASNIQSYALTFYDSNDQYTNVTGLHVNTLNEIVCPRDTVKIGINITTSTELDPSKVVMTLNVYGNTNTKIYELENNTGQNSLYNSKILIMGDSISTDSCDKFNFFANYKKWVTNLCEENVFKTSNVTNNSYHATGFVATYQEGGVVVQDTFYNRLVAVQNKSPYDMVITFGGVIRLATSGRMKCGWRAMGLQQAFRSVRIIRRHTERVKRPCKVKVVSQRTAFLHPDMMQRRRIATGPGGYRRNKNSRIWNTIVNGIGRK